MYMYAMHMYIHMYMYVTTSNKLPIIWKMTGASSSKDHGTFWHLCSRLGHSASAKDPKKDMNACTDILITVLKGHYIAAACSILRIDDPEDKPKSLPALHQMSARERYLYIMNISS